MKKTLLLFMAVLLTFALHAQGLFTPITDAAAGLSTKDAEHLASLRLNPTYESITMVQVADVATAETNGKLDIYLPGLPKLTAVAYSIEHASDIPTTDFSWEGTLYKDTAVNGGVVHEGGGTMTLYRRNGEVFGFIRDQFSGNVFELASFAPGKNALIKYNRDIFTNAKEDGDYTGTAEPAEKVTGSPCNTHSRVFVFYTEAAKNAVPNINNTIQTAIGDLYGTVNNSLGNQDEVSFELVGTQELQNFTEVTSGFSPIGATLDAFSTNNTVITNRDAAAADICVLLTDGNFMADNKKVWGLSVPGPSYQAFSVIEADLCNPQYTFSHEVGHLLGAQHTWCGDESEDGCDGAGTLAHPKKFSRFNFFGSLTYETVMYIIDGPNRSHLWSTPHKKIWNTEMGDLDHRYNTQIITDNACTVASFRPDTGTFFHLTVTGTHAAHTGGNITLHAIPHDGSLPYGSYEWKMETGLFTNIVLPSTTDVLTVAMSNDDHAYFSVFLHDNVGRVASASHKVANFDSKYIDQWDGQDAHNRVAKQNNEAGLIVAPNPATETLNIVALIPAADLQTAHNVTVTDIMGKVVYSNNSFSNGEQTNFVVNTENLPSGTYFVKLSGGSANKIVKVAVKH